MSKPCKIRQNFGSHRTVIRVFAYDPLYGKALVLLRSDYGDRDDLAEMSLNELEAVDAAGVYGDLKSELEKRAGFVLSEEFSA